MAPPSSDPSGHSPRSARPSRGPSSPWSHVVRGESEAIPASPSSPSAAAAAAAAAIPASEPSDRSSPNPKEGAKSPDHGINGNAAGGGGGSAGKRPAWGRPSNGSAEVGPVMGAESWPALSEAAKAFPKLLSTDSVKDGSSSATASPGPVAASPLPKPTTSSPNPNSARQKSMKRSGGGGNVAPANGGPPPALAEAHQIPPEKPAGSESSPKDSSNKSNNSNWDYGSSSRGGGVSTQSHGNGPDHHRPYNRRNNNTNGSYGGRRDPERGGHEWNPSRNFSGRDAHMPMAPHQQRGHPRPFTRPPPPPPPPGLAPPFVTPPPPVRPFVPVGYPDMSYYYVPAPAPAPAPPHPESLRGLPFVPVHPMPPTMFLAATDHQRAILVKQIDYYFSSDNLCKDVFLRQNMDDQGWVPISLIAGFNRVKQLTNNIQYILDAVRSSEILEIEGDKIRRRNDWMNWILRTRPNQNATASGPVSPASPHYEGLATSMQNVALEGAHSEGVSGNFRNQSQVGGTHGEGNGQVVGHSSSDQ